MVSSKQVPLKFDPDVIIISSASDSEISNVEIQEAIFNFAKDAEVY